MSWELRYSKRAVKQLKKLDRKTAALITSWMSRNVDGCDDPRAHGKALTGNLKGAWRYRVGDYRILCEIRDAELVVVAVQIAHRREVYEQR